MTVVRALARRATERTNGLDIPEVRPPVVASGTVLKAEARRRCRKEADGVSTLPDRRARSCRAPSVAAPRDSLESCRGRTGMYSHTSTQLPST